MDTREEQLAFFGEHQADMVKAAIAGGGAAVIEFISGFDETEQLVLYGFHSRPLSFQDWEGKNMDTIADVGNAALDYFINLADAAPSKEARLELLTRANFLAYNVAANLAGVWPEDPMPREARHHEIGLRAAELSIDWRTQFGLPAINLAGAWWIKGVHELGLGDYAGLLETWTKAYDYTIEAVKDAGGDPEVSPSSTPGHVVNYGYTGIARMLNGDESGKAIHQTAITLLEGMADDEKRGNDARMFAGQLNTTWERYGN